MEAQPSVHYLKQLDQAVMDLREQIETTSEKRSEELIILMRVAALHSEALARIARDLKRLRADLDPTKRSKDD